MTEKTSVKAVGTDAAARAVAGPPAALAPTTPAGMREPASEGGSTFGPPGRGDERASASLRGQGAGPARPPHVAPLAALALAGAVGLAFVLAGLFARLQGRTLADQETRRRICEALRASPGATAKDLAERLAVHKTTIDYHLRIMAKTSWVKARASGNRRHYYLAQQSAPLPRAPDLAAHQGLARALYEIVAADPGVSVRDVAVATRAHRTTVHYHVRRLQEIGLLDSQRRGKHLRLFARPTLP